MANTKSAQKQARRNEKRRLINRVHRNRARTAVKKARLAMESGDVTASAEAVREAARWLDHAASKGVIHKNNASRRKARLMRRLAQIEAQQK